MHCVFIFSVSGERRLVHYLTHNRPLSKCCTEALPGGGGGGPMSPVWILKRLMSVFILAERVYNFATHAKRVDHARITSELRFRFGHKSFYRFGICSCLATSHKQILKTPFNMTSSCILGFQATHPVTWAHFIHHLFIVRWQIAKYFWGK